MLNNIYQKKMETEYTIDYTIDYLVDRAYDIINKTKQKKKTNFVKPEIINHNRKTYITNFIKFCESIDRDPHQIKKFLEKELSIQTSLIGESNLADDKSGLKIDVNLRANAILNCIMGYMKEYVMCKYCKSATNIEKRDKLTYMKCQTCLSEMSI